MRSPNRYLSRRHSACRVLWVCEYHGSALARVHSFPPTYPPCLCLTILVGVYLSFSFPFDMYLTLCKTVMFLHMCNVHAISSLSVVTTILSLSRFHDFTPTLTQKVELIPFERSRTLVHDFSSFCLEVCWNQRSNVDDRANKKKQTTTLVCVWWKL